MFGPKGPVDITGLGNGLASKLLHITYTNVSHMATLGLNELN